MNVREIAKPAHIFFLLLYFARYAAISFRLQFYVYVYVKQKQAEAKSAEERLTL